MFFLRLVLLIATAHAEILVGHVYPHGVATSGPSPYTQNTTIQARHEGGEELTSSIVNQSGDVLMTEHAVFNGLQLLSEEIDHKQTGKSFKVTVSDGKKLSVDTYEVENGERKLESHKTETVDGDLICGPLSHNYFKAHWQELAKGQKFNLRFLVLETGGTVGFSFQKKSMTDKEIVIEMRPSSFFIRMMVDPIYLTFDLATKRLVHYSGRTPVRVKDGSKWKPVEGDIVYETSG